jgi:hypothetical protein
MLRGSTLAYAHPKLLSGSGCWVDNAEHACCPEHVRAVAMLQLEIGYEHASRSGPPIRRVFSIL